MSDLIFSSPDFSLLLLTYSMLLTLLSSLHCCEFVVADDVADDFPFLSC